MDFKLKQTIDDGPMSGFQWVAIAICVMLNALDGMDVLVMAFTAASVSGEWKLNGAQLGLLFSAGLVGMAIGSVLIAPLADRWGRQRVTLGCLATISAGMLLSVATRNLYELAAMRLVTGLGIGGVLASVTVIVVEYSSKRLRSLNIALYTAGYSVGAVIGGVVAAWLLSIYGWRSVFLFGGLATAAMIPVVMLRLPESVDFLVARRPEGALAKLNRLLQRMGHAPLAQLPARQVDGVASGSTLAGLFKNGLARSTLLLWAAYFLLMFSLYFALSWTPKLLVAAGLSANQGITGGVVMNLGGIIGTVVFGLLAVNARLSSLTAWCLGLAAVCMAAFGAASGTLLPAFAAAFGIGLFIFSSMAGLYAVAPSAYPVAVRTTGVGYAIGFGRLGAILAPVIAGMLLDGGWKPPSLYWAYAVPLVVAALCAVASATPRGRVSAVAPLTVPH